MNTVAPSGGEGQREILLQPPTSAAWGRIPAELRQLHQWVVAGPDKAPRRADGGPASPTDSTTWTDFNTACRAAAATGGLPGFVISVNDPFACIDLDVNEGTTAEQLKRHQSIVDTMGSYTERSRSGSGRHVWVRANIGKGCKRDGVEVYSQERYIICTGDVCVERPIEDRQALAENMVSRMRPAITTTVEFRADTPKDDQDWYIAQTAFDDAGKMGDLFRTPWQKSEEYPSQSEADFALMLALARVTESNGACREAFRLSALGRRDKATRDDRYLNLTLGNVRPIVAEEAYHADQGREIARGMFWPKPPITGRLRLLVDDDLDRLPPLRWLVKGIIPDAGIGTVYGDSGTFKSFLVLDLLAHLANGQEWFGRRVRLAPAAYVPFEGQGGIPSRIKAWRLAETRRRRPDGLFTAEPDADVRSSVAVIMASINLREAADRDVLVEALTNEGHAGGVLCIDTLAHASAGIDENSSAMGEMLGIFRELQQRLGGVILLVHHSGKDQSRGMRGWSGLHAAMDFVIECKRLGDGGSRDSQFQLAKVKDGSSGTAFPFTMGEVQLGFDEDGDATTSLVVISHDCETDDSGGKQSRSRKPGTGLREIDAETSAKDDAFILKWIDQQIALGNHPSKNSLKGQLALMKAVGQQITQDRVPAAVDRLMAEGRLAREPKSPTGNSWLRPIEATPGGSLAC